MDKNVFYKMLESGEFARMVSETTPGKRVNNPQEIYNHIFPLYANSFDDKESFICIFLDSKNRIIEIKKLFEGTVNRCAVYPREILKAALKKPTTAMILTHNHPSGDVEPSIDDINLTKKIIIALLSVDIHLHDHLIVGKNEFYSFADLGKIAEAKAIINSFINGFH